MLTRQPQAVAPHLAPLMFHPPSHGAPSRARRFLFCTNECVGLGHMRRTLPLARAVTEMDESASALVLTGAPLTPGLSLPAGVDTVKLPMLQRDPVSGLGARNLQIESADLHDRRGALGFGGATAFAPDVTVI